MLKEQLEDRPNNNALGNAHKWYMTQEEVGMRYSTEEEDTQQFVEVYCTMYSDFNDAQLIVTTV